LDYMKGVALMQAKAKQSAIAGRDERLGRSTRAQT